MALLLVVVLILLYLPCSGYLTLTTCHRPNPKYSVITPMSRHLNNQGLPSNEMSEDWHMVWLLIWCPTYYKSLILRLSIKENYIKNFWMISIAWKENNPVTYCVFFLVHTFVLFFFHSWYRILLCSFMWLETLFPAQADFKVMIILLL